MNCVHTLKKRTDQGDVKSEKSENSEVTCGVMNYKMFLKQMLNISMQLNYSVLTINGGCFGYCRVTVA